MCGLEESTVLRRKASTRRWMHRSGNRSSCTRRVRRRDTGSEKSSNDGACCDLYAPDCQEGKFSKVPMQDLGQTRAQSPRFQLRAATAPHPLATDLEAGTKMRYVRCRSAGSEGRLGTNSS